MSGRWDGVLAHSLAVNWPMLYFGYSGLTVNFGKLIPIGYSYQLRSIRLMAKK